MIKERRAVAFRLELIKAINFINVAPAEYLFPESDRREIKVLHAAVRNAETCNNYEIRDKYN